MHREMSANNLYKTSLCRSFESSGTCSNGKECKYAHGERELRRTETSVDNNNLYKTSLCRSFESSGTCSNGKECKYAHGERELRRTNNNIIQTKRDQSDRNILPGANLKSYHATEKSVTSSSSKSEQHQATADKSGLPPIDFVKIFHDGENLAIGDGFDVVRIKKALIAATTKGRPSRELEAEPETEWTYYLGSSSGTTERTLQNLRVAGATISLCGAKKGAVDISLKNEVNKELVDLRSRVAAERARHAVLLASSDSDFAQEIRNFKSIGVRVGIVCGVNVNNTYRDQSDFFVHWPITSATSSNSAGKGRDVIIKESSSSSSSTFAGAGDNSSSISSDSLERFQQAWCDAIAEELVKVLDKGEEISLPNLGQVAAPLKPTGAPKSLKLEATIREDEKKRFKLNGEGTDIVVTFKSRGGRGGGAKVDSTFSTKSQASSKGISEASSEALRIQCNSIYSKLNKEFQVEGGLSLSTLGTLASDLRPVGGDSLRLEASLSEDSRFILVKGKEGTFARLRGGKRKGGRDEKNGTSNAAATATFRKHEKEKSVKRNNSSNDDGNDKNDIEQLRELWCDEIARVLEDELDANEEVFVSSLGVLVSSLRPPGGEGLKLEATLRADSRFDVQGKGLEAVVRLIDDAQSELTPSPYSELGYLAGSNLVSKGSELVSKGSELVSKGSELVSKSSEFLISILSPPPPSVSVSKSPVVKDDSNAQYEEAKRLRDIEANEAIRIRRLEEERKREEEKIRQEQLKSSMMMTKKLGKWVRKGKEGDYVTIPSGTLVRYGAGERWVESTIKFAFPFLISNDSFKGDPCPGVGKCLEIWEEGK
jgi:hypothetical protein